MRNSLIIALFWCLSSFLAVGQQSADRVLFTVNGVEVTVSEFDYIYSKTGQEEAQYDEASLREYLELYINFKLKVQKARDLQLDTIPQLQRELEGYRKQLADSYLMDREVTERLLREAYERTLEDVDISHMLFRIPPGADPAAEAAALAKAQEARQKVRSGLPFEQVAREMSEDPAVEENGGRIGYLTAVFPNGYYDFETAAYTQPLNAVGEPVRSPSGYHLIWVHDRRPARGEIEVAHLLIRKREGEDPARAKARIDSLNERLQAGEKFEELVLQYSEDRRTKANKGYLGFFGIKRYELPFEEAAFALPEDGAVSAPVETSVGWHLIKRISRRGIQPFDIAGRRLETVIKRDGRFEEARKALVEQIKAESGFRENPEVREAYASTLSASFFTPGWKPDALPEKAEKPLFTLGTEAVGLKTFQDFLRRSVRQRMALASGKDPSAAIAELYEDFVEDHCIRYEEGRLEEKYPEFKALMREYREGILLFEATKILVWDRASRDTAGLEAFYETIEGKYRWEERLRLTDLAIAAEAKDRLEAVQAAAAQLSEAELKEKYGAEDSPVQISERLVERSQAEAIEGLQWEAGSLSTPRQDPATGMTTFSRVEEVLPARNKELEEARGYIIADYQDQLEKEWVKALREEYPVEVNEKVFQSLVRTKSGGSPR